MVHCIRRGLVFGIFANSLTRKATHVVLVYLISCCFSVYIFFVVTEGGEKGIEVANLIERETKPSRFVLKFRNAFFWVLGCKQWLQTKVASRAVVLPATKRDMFCSTHSGGYRLVLRVERG